MALAGDELLLHATKSRSIHIYNKYSGQFVRSISLSNYIVTYYNKNGMVYVPDRGSIFLLFTNIIEERLVSDGQLLQTLQIPTAPTILEGIAYNGTSLIVTNSQSQLIYLDPDTGQIERTTPAVPYLTDLAYHITPDVTFQPPQPGEMRRDGGDLYQLTLTPGQTVTLATTTPMDHVGSLLPNNLDVVLALIDRNTDEVIAVADGGSSDDRNALLTYTSATGGDFYVQVIAKSGQGEYLLSTDIADAPPPSITGVFVSSTGWTNSFRDYLAGQNHSTLGYNLLTEAEPSKPLPWANLNRLAITFDENVTVQSSDLILTGVSTPTYSIVNFQYDSATYTGTWTFAEPMSNDRLRINLRDTVTSVITAQMLDGEWSAVAPLPVYTGDGQPGGHFRLGFDVLTGDINRSGRVSSADAPLFQVAYNASSTSSRYNMWADLDGSARVSSTDLPLYQSFFNRALVIGEPEEPLFGFLDEP